MTIEPTATPTPRRRWLQYSLRTLLVLVLLLSLPLAWFALKIRKAERQRQAVDAIATLGGWVRYDYQFNSSGVYIQGARPPGPEWLRKLVGHDLFTHVTMVSLQPRYRFSLAVNRIGDDALEHLRQFTELQRLSLLSTKVTDAGLEHLGGLS